LKKIYFQIFFVCLQEVSQNLFSGKSDAGLQGIGLC